MTVDRIYLMQNFSCENEFVVKSKLAFMSYIF